MFKVDRKGNIASKYVYAQAVVDATGVNVVRLDGGQPTRYAGRVHKIGPNCYVAQRNFGCQDPKTFSGPATGFIINEHATAMRALRWACNGFDHIEGLTT